MKLVVMGDQEREKILSVYFPHLEKLTLFCASPFMSSISKCIVHLLQSPSLNKVQFVLLHGSLPVEFLLCKRIQTIGFYGRCGFRLPETGTEHDEIRILTKAKAAMKGTEELRALTLSNRTVFEQLIYLEISWNEPIFSTRTYAETLFAQAFKSLRVLKLAMFKLLRCSDVEFEVDLGVLECLEEIHLRFSLPAPSKIPLLLNTLKTLSTKSMMTQITFDIMFLLPGADSERYWEPVDELLQGPIWRKCNMRLGMKLDDAAQTRETETAIREELQKVISQGRFSIIPTEWE
ncbi:hypothetical protein H0H92_001805 [Tricholoma furcatifolium]|nr:hypothetical protein H0H92_001805 [Tricholoma furcatifolium]